MRFLFGNFGIGDDEREIVETPVDITLSYSGIFSRSFDGKIDEILCIMLGIFKTASLQYLVPNRRAILLGLDKNFEATALNQTALVDIVIIDNPGKVSFGPALPENAIDLFQAIQNV
jgi:hypothetical protein